MNKAILFILVVIFCQCAKAQSVTKPGESYSVYCNVMGYNFWGLGKVKVLLDLGRKTGTKGYDSIYEENGKKKKFNTMMAALNYMGQRGWKCINTYYITKGNANVIHFLLEKWVSSDDQITEGLILKSDTENPWKPGQDKDDMY